MAWAFNTTGGPSMETSGTVSADAVFPAVSVTVPAETVPTGNIETIMRSDAITANNPRRPPLADIIAAITY